MRIILLLILIVLLIFSAIGSLAVQIHKKTIKEFIDNSKLYTGEITDNYYFERLDIGGPALTRTEHMICLKSEEAPQTESLFCSTQYISKKLATQLPIGTKTNFYYRDDIHETLLQSAVENWQRSLFFQKIPQGVFLFSLLGILIVKVTIKKRRIS